MGVQGCSQKGQQHPVAGRQGPEFSDDVHEAVIWATVTTVATVAACLAAVHALLRAFNGPLRSGRRQARPARGTGPAAAGGQTYNGNLPPARGGLAGRLPPDPEPESPR